MNGFLAMILGCIGGGIYAIVKLRFRSVRDAR